MMKMNRVLSIVACVSIGLCTSHAFPDVSDGSGHMTEPGTLDGAAPSNEWAANMREERTRVVKQLLAIAQAKKMPEKRRLSPSSPQVLAIELLGEYRAEEAVEFLVDNITMYAPGLSIDEDGPAIGYPCVHALVNIGLPSVKEILKRLNFSVTEKELRLYNTVIWMVDGDVGLLRLENALKHATEKNRANLKTLIRMHKAKEWQF